MRLQDQKASITKAIRKHLRYALSIKKISYKRNDNSSYSITLTPGSDMLYMVSTKNTEMFHNRISIPRFSDYIVCRKEYEDFIVNFRKKGNSKK